MSITRLVTVEFVGGPLDGFQQEAPPADNDSGGFLVLPINANIIQAVSGDRIGRRRGATSVAIYELSECSPADTAQVYRYVGPATVEAFHFDKWAG